MRELLTKDEDIAAFLLNGVLSMDWASSGLVVLDGDKLDQLRVFELGNRLLLSK
jgi:hypothetical protein